MSSSQTEQNALPQLRSFHM